jgi:DNA-binding beta-propeller fold protein YncE
MRISGLGYFVFCGSFLLLVGYIVASPPKGAYHLHKSVPLGAAEGGDEYYDLIALDAGMRRVYLTHGTEVRVVNADSGTEVGTITGMKKSHAVAMVQELGKGFITDGGADEVLVFDLKTLKVTGRVKTDSGPDSIMYDPASKRIFSFNGHANDATVIEPRSETVVGTIPMGGVPEFAVSDGKGTIYDNIENTSELAVIDSHALKIKARWPVAPAETPGALAIDRQHRRLFIAGEKMFVVMNADNGKVIKSFPISAGQDADAFDPETGLVFVSTREGMIHIFHEDSPDKYSVVEPVKTEYGAKCMALDPKTHNLFLDTSDFGPPPPATAQQPHPLPARIPGAFRLLIFGT